MLAPDGDIGIRGPLHCPDRKPDFTAYNAAPWKDPNNRPLNSPRKPRPTAPSVRTLYDPTVPDDNRLPVKPWMMGKKKKEEFHKPVKTYDPNGPCSPRIEQLAIKPPPPKPYPRPTQSTSDAASVPWRPKTSLDRDRCQQHDGLTPWIPTGHMGSLNDQVELSQIIRGDEVRARPPPLLPSTAPPSLYASSTHTRAL